VPDDVTLLWAEDNWGNIRRLPTAEERGRPGGAGVYYHFDYHGGPRSYKWININPIAKIWEQMSLAKQYGADRIWIVNVGHFKGYEFPMEFFLNFAWDTTRWNNENLGEYTRLWAEREFGAPYAAEAAEIIGTYSKFNGRRKPELLDANTYSLVNFNEYERIVEEYNALVAKAQALYDRLPSLEYRMFLHTPGAMTVNLTLAPTINFVAGRGLRTAVSFDDEAPKIVNILPADYQRPEWKSRLGRVRPKQLPYSQQRPHGDWRGIPHLEGLDGGPGGCAAEDRRAYAPVVETRDAPRPAGEFSAIADPETGYSGSSPFR
jgi:hypothetical protein